MSATKANVVAVPQRITIDVGSSGIPTVYPDTIVVDRDKGDYEVEWVCPSGKQYYVCFVYESPFEQRHFHSGNGRSGRAKDTATGRYKYTVEVDGQILDPTIIIKP
jgi:hypothetical protein